MSRSKIPDWIDPSQFGGGVSIMAILVNRENGWDQVFPYNAGSVTEPLDPVWTDPGNNVRIRRSEIRRFEL